MEGIDVGVCGVYLGIDASNLILLNRMDSIVSRSSVQFKSFCCDVYIYTFLSPRFLSLELVEDEHGGPRQEIGK